VGNYPSGMSGRTALMLIVGFAVICYLAWRVLAHGG